MTDGRTKPEVIDLSEDDDDDKLDNFEPLSVEFEPKSTKVECTEFKILLGTTEAQTDKGIIDREFLDSMLETSAANRLINGLEGQDKRYWRNFQIALTDAASNPRLYSQLLQGRNKHFPEIARHLDEAAKRFASGESKVPDYDRKQFFRQIEKKFGPDAARRTREYFQASAQIDAQKPLFNVGSKPHTIQPMLFSHDPAAARRPKLAVPGTPTMNLRTPRLNFNSNSDNSKLDLTRTDLWNSSMERPTPTELLIEGASRLTPSDLWKTGASRPTPADLSKNGASLSASDLWSNGANRLASPNQNIFASDSHGFFDQSDSAFTLSLETLFRPRKNFPSFFSRSEHQPDQLKVDHYDSHYKRIAQEELRKINHPGPREAASMRADRFVEIMSKAIPENILRADVGKFLSNHRSSEQSKYKFFEHLERLIPSRGAPTFAAPEDRLVVALQLLSQAANIKDVDQGGFGICALSAIEKRLLARDPDILAGLIADGAIHGTATTRTLRTIKLEKDWLKYDNEDADGYPPAENIRSLASQYAAMVLGNVRYQIHNEKNGTDIRYGHKDGKDLVLDCSVNPPAPLYENNLTQKLDREKNYRFDDGRIMVDAKLKPLEKPSANDPSVDATDLLDTYEAVVGSSANGLALMSYSEARRPGDYSLSGWRDWWYQTEKVKDDRLMVFRNEPQLGEHLKLAKQRDNYPLILLTPHHAANVDNYNAETKRADYDNHWGRKNDFFGDNALPLSELIKIAATDTHASEEPLDTKRMMELLVQVRKEYDDWCTANGVKPETRYPTDAEYTEWKKNQEHHR
ncbi:MAG: hypothetical protein K2X93_10880 [Candidatus Obscuribacterales bacterium]|nr:hypothetical protein [Candidatus Obscuribacterales bacterium]